MIQENKEAENCQIKKSQKEVFLIPTCEARLYLRERKEHEDFFFFPFSKRESSKWTLQIFLSHIRSTKLLVDNLYIVFIEDIL